MPNFASKRPNGVLMDGLVWSYLPLFQYDATLFRGVNSKKSKEEIMKFDLKLVLSF